MWSCEKCGREVSQDRKHCPDCGAFGPFTEDESENTDSSLPSVIFRFFFNFDPFAEGKDGKKNKPTTLLVFLLFIFVVLKGISFYVKNVPSRPEKNNEEPPARSVGLTEEQQETLEIIKKMRQESGDSEESAVPPYLRKDGPARYGYGGTGSGKEKGESE